MARASFVSKRGVTKMSSEVFTCLASTYKGTLTDTERLTGGSWTGVNATVVDTAGSIDVTNTSAGGYGTRSITTLTKDAPYVLVLDFILGAGGDGTVRVISGGVNITKTITSSGPISVGFTAGATTAEIRLENENATGTNTYDNITIKDGVIDISDSNNGCHIVGSITTGSAEVNTALVSYSGFSTSNYIRQQYNDSNLHYDNASTENFYYGGWVKTQGTGTIFNRSILGGSTGSKFELYIDSSTNALVFEVAEAYTPVDNVSYTAGISDLKWHHVMCVYRIVFKGTASEKTVLELWVDGILVNTTDVTANADILLTNGTARLTFGADNNNAVPLTGGELALWHSAPYAPLYGEIQTAYKNEKRLFRYYSAFSVVDTNYSFDIRYSTLDRTYRAIQNKSRSIGGLQYTNTSRTEQQWAITTIPLSRVNGVLDSYTIFLESVIEGETFTFDAYGLAGYPQEPISCYLVDNDYSEVRKSSSEYFTLSFGIVEK